MGKFDDKPNIIFAFAFMIGSACLLNFLGARRSVGYARVGKTEAMSKTDAMKFPLTGSCVLGGLYVLFKYLPKEYLVLALSVYLTLISVITLSSAVRPVVGANVLIGLCCCAVGASWFFTKDWILNNILAFAICISGIEAVQLSEFKVSFILLWGLFLYDIFWVFGTDVMVTVATSVEGPIKLLFPHDIFGEWKEKSLLGLGDIVIPGFFISQTLRFSLTMWQRRQQKKGDQKKKLELPENFSMLSWDQSGYFLSVFFSYFCSLVVAMYIMVTFEAAQPVLLYIVPFTIFTALGHALIRGEFWDLWNFSEGAATTEEGAAEEEDKKKEGDATEKKDEEPGRGFVGSAVFFVKETLLFVFGLDEETLKEKTVEADKKKK